MAARMYVIFDYVSIIVDIMGVIIDLITISQVQRSVLRCYRSDAAAMPSSLKIRAAVPEDAARIVAVLTMTKY
jgi:hypothetical protein